MRLPISWLKDYVKVDVSAEELAHRLALTGQDVDTVESDVIFTGVVIGEVIEREKHPNADKLNVAKVNVGKETLQIVCGAPNLNVGQKVPVAIVGAKLGDFEIGRAVLRGVESHGMICSEKELGIGENHEGIMVLEKKAQTGTDFGEYLGRDKVIDIKTAANRPDCMGIIGLAREVGATLKRKINIPAVKLIENKDIKTSDFVDVQIKDKELCPVYAARVVKGVKVGPSPKWLQERLLSVNVRPINNLVDVSNYVMFETGQPLHFFDLTKVTGNENKATIIVRRAQKGEEIVTLDGNKRKLTDEMLLISDKKKGIALAGVMGGENTEVDDKTTDVLIEAAVFDKANIRRTSRALGLRSEAVARMEKGLPQALPINAIERAAELLVELAGGKVATGQVVAGISEVKPAVLKLDYAKLNAFLGIEIPKSEVLRVFELLEFGTNEKGEYLEVTVPWWRRDLALDADLYEEVIRIWGFEKLPSTLPKTVTGKTANNKSYTLNKEVRKLLSDIGLYEILTYSFIGKKELEAVGENIEEAPKVANPLVSEQEYMRTSLVPHMLMALRDNQFNRDEVALFEIGKSFKLKKNQKLPVETKMLTIGVMGGKSWPIDYIEGQNFYEIKGVLDRLLSDLKLYHYPVEIRKTQNHVVETGQAAEVLVDSKVIGYFGEVSLKVLNQFDLKRKAGILYINLDQVEEIWGKTVVFEEFSKFPKVTRDLSVIMEKTKEVGEFVKAVVAIDKLIYKVEVVDIYQGSRVEKDEKSVTFRIEIWSDEKTLTDSEIEKVINSCKNVITKLGGKIRGEKS